MSMLLRTSELEKRPVVTLAGEDPAQVKDVVYSADGGAVAGFTLNGRGLFAGPSKQALPWASVSALGPDALIISAEDVLVDAKEWLGGLGTPTSAAGRGDVLGSRVLTDTGTDLGKVVDVILEVEAADECDVVGYEVDPSEALGKGSKKVYIPLPDTLAASGQNLVVPDAAKDFVTEDLAGFGAAVDAFRSRLAEGRAATPPPADDSSGSSGSSSVAAVRKV